MLRDLLVVLGVALGVYLPKALPLLAFSGDLAPALRRWLSYVARAVPAALVAPVVLAPARQLAPPSWEQAGSLVAFLVALATRRMLPALGAGLVIVSAVALLRG